MNEKKFIEELKKINIKLNEKQLQQLEKYYELLIEWNQKINLTAITEKEQVYLKHFYDSMTIVKIIDFNKNKIICDVGSGAGFPGLIIKILFPHLEVVLIDSLNKRIRFLEEVIEKLNLDKVTCIHSRIEDYAKENREKYDIVTARAVAPLNILLEYCIPLVKENKYFIGLKGSISQEIKRSERCLEKLDSKIEEVKEFKLPSENSNRSLIKIIKNKKTNKKYPRNNKEIKKYPL